MKLNNTDQDKKQWEAFHSEDSLKVLSSLKLKMQEELVSTIDELIGTSEINKKNIVHLSDCKSHDNLPQSIKKTIDDAVQKLKIENEVVKRLANFYLVLLDINTYAYNCFLSEDDWEWRAFARHIFTVLYEHRNSINPLLNNVIKTMKESLGTGVSLTAFIKAKKDFVKVIDSIADYAQTIRVNVDAHFDGDFEKRIRIIEGMSYFEIVKLLNVYWTKTAALIHEMPPIILALQNYVFDSMHDVEHQLKEFIEKAAEKVEEQS